jgi:hypothetical protein
LALLVIQQFGFVWGTEDMIKIIRSALLIVLISSSAFGQNVRWDLPLLTTQAQGGNLLPVYAIPGALVSFYNEPSGTLATTYNSATSISPCPTGAQVTLNGSAACVGTADPSGNMGGWFLPGQYMAAITSPFQSYNYLFTITGNPGGGISVVTNPAGNQTIVQPPGTSLTINGNLNGTDTNGVINESLYPGSTVAARVNAAAAACGTLYTTACIILIPANEGPGNGWNLTSNNVLIEDDRINNGQGIYSNGSNDPLPNLHGLLQINYQAGTNDASETIAIPYVNITGCSITADVATCTNSGVNGFTATENILISGLSTLTQLNSNLNVGTTYTILSTGLSSTQFEFNITTSNVSFTADTGIAGAPCSFCGKNVLVVDAQANGGGTTNGSNASLVGLNSQITRTAGTRQIEAANFEVNCILDGLPSHFCEGMEIDTVNASGSDDTGLAGTAIRLVNAGKRWGIGIQLTDDGGTSASGWEFGETINNYHINGIQLSSGDVTSNADIAIIPPANDTRLELQGLNAADNATVWSINDLGQASFPSIVNVPMLNIQNQFTAHQEFVNQAGGVVATMGQVDVTGGKVLRVLNSPSTNTVSVQALTEGVADDQTLALNPDGGPVTINGQLACLTDGTNCNIKTVTPTAGQAACIKSTAPVVIGYCSTVVSALGACTCN